MTNPQAILALLQFTPAELKAMYAILDTASAESEHLLEEERLWQYDPHVLAELKDQASVITKLRQLLTLMNVEEVGTYMPMVGDHITTTAPVTRIVGQVIYTIEAGLTGIVVGGGEGDEWVRIRTDDGEIEVYCDPDHADPWHAFTIEEVQNG